MAPKNSKKSAKKAVELEENPEYVAKRQRNNEVRIYFAITRFDFVN